MLAAGRVLIGCAVVPRRVGVPPEPTAREFTPKSPEESSDVLAAPVSDDAVPDAL